MYNRIVIIILAVIISGCSGKSPVRKDVKVDHVTLSEIPVLFDGRPVTGWIATNFGPQGPVSVSDRDIILGMGDGCTGITWQGQFPETNYQVALDAKRVEGNDFFCGMTFPVGKAPCTLIVGGWGGTTVGLSSIDGEDAARNQTRKLMSFEKNRWYHIRLAVTEKNLTAWIDTIKAVDFDIKAHRLSIRPEVELSRPFGIVSWNTTAVIRNVVVTVR
jgi:hypothetical protein